MSLLSTFPADNITPRRGFSKPDAGFPRKKDRFSAGRTGPYRPEKCRCVSGYGITMKLKINAKIAQVSITPSAMR